MMLPMLEPIDKESDSVILARIRIPYHIKDAILKNLTLLGIDKESLFLMILVRFALESRILFSRKSIKSKEV